MEILIPFCRGRETRAFNRIENKILNLIFLKLFNFYKKKIIIFHVSNTGLFTTSNNENVGKSGSKGSSGSVLDVDDIEGSWVTIAGCNDTNSPQVMTSGDHAKVSGIELFKVKILVLK